MVLVLLYSVHGTVCIVLFILYNVHCAVCVLEIYSLVCVLCCCFIVCVDGLLWLCQDFLCGWLWVCIGCIMLPMLLGSEQLPDSVSVYFHCFSVSCVHYDYGAVVVVVYSNQLCVNTTVVYVRRVFTQISLKRVNRHVSAVF